VTQSDGCFPQSREVADAMGDMALAYVDWAASQIGKLTRVRATNPNFRDKKKKKMESVPSKYVLFFGEFRVGVFKHVKK
jgi:hypothetical protein